MNQVLDWKKPYHRFFEEMSRIPHGSYNEKEYSDYLVEFAKSRGLQYKQYEIGNVIIYKAASLGYEDHPTVVLQAHMDMVCEKVPQSDHDFEKDPLQLYIEDGWLHAKGTTLGADDGTGVAYILSILDDDTLAHPALECVFTVQEEVGLFGAFALEPEDLKGRRYISLDDGGGGKKTITTSAGGLCWSGTLPLQKTETLQKGFRLTVGGLQGGHSGECINQEKGNSIKICTRILKMLENQGELILSAINGGSKDNAIPRDCVAEFVSELNEAAVKAECEKLVHKIQQELAYSDNELTVKVEEAEIRTLFSAGDSARLLNFLLVCPTGMRHRSMNLEGLTVASENLAVIITDENQVIVTVSLRSAYESYLDEMASELNTLAALCEMRAEESARYPAWAYEEGSKMREIMKEAVKKSMGIELEMLAVHGGLECGVFKQKWPDMDMVTMGPVGLDVHSPNERLDLQSFDECYKLLKEFLALL